MTHVDRYRLPHPTGLYIAVSNRCNLRCPMCDHGRLDPTVYANMDIEWSTLHRLEPFLPHAEIIWLSGYGESLLHPDFEDIVAYCRSHAPKADIGIMTNGTLLSSDVSRMLVRSTIDHVRVSHDGWVAWGHAGGGQDAGKVENNIRSLQAMKVELGLNRPRITLHFVAMKDNLARLPELLLWAKTLGIQTVGVQPLMPNHNWLRDQNIYRHLDVCRPLLRSSVKLAEELGISLFPQDMTFEMDSKRRPCSPAFEWMYIDHNGNVGICCAGLRTGENVNQRPVEEIWNGDVYLGVRRALSAGEPKGLCSKCPEVENTIENQEYVYLDRRIEDQRRGLEDWVACLEDGIAYRDSRIRELEQAVGGVRSSLPYRVLAGLRRLLSPLRGQV